VKTIFVFSNSPHSFFLLLSPLPPTLCTFYWLLGSLFFSLSLSFSVKFNRVAYFEYCRRHIFSPSSGCLPFLFILFSLKASTESHSVIVVENFSLSLSLPPNNRLCTNTEENSFSLFLSFSLHSTIHHKSWKKFFSLRRNFHSFFSPFWLFFW
jgi:hypothetical protein